LSNIHSWIILGHTGSGKSHLTEQFRSGSHLPEAFTFLEGKRGFCLSLEDQAQFLEDEKRRDQSDILEYQDMGTLLKDFLPEPHSPLISRFHMEGLLNQGISFMSTGERRKTFLLQGIQQAPDYMVLENPLEGLDLESSAELKELLLHLEIPLILILSRSEDIPRGFDNIFILEEQKLIGPGRAEEMLPLFQKPQAHHEMPALIPPSPVETGSYALGQELIRMDGINLAYYGKAVLQDIHWQVKEGDFWQLIGPNGSGKSTLLSLINGDNPRAYGQEIYLFGQKKGSGESIWDIKKKIGQFSPALQQDFRRKISLGETILSGFEDSVGIYKKIPGYRRLLMKSWLNFIPFKVSEDQLLSELSAGQQRLVLLIRALVKHPPLLLLDEPLAGLDSEMADYMARLINLAAKQSQSTMIFVSHRPEPRLHARQRMTLIPGTDGSRGVIDIS